MGYYFLHLFSLAGFCCLCTLTVMVVDWEMLMSISLFSIPYTLLYIVEWVLEAQMCTLIWYTGISRDPWHLHFLFSLFSWFLSLTRATASFFSLPFLTSLHLSLNPSSNFSAVYSPIQPPHMRLKSLWQVYCFSVISQALQLAVLALWSTIILSVKLSLKIKENQIKSWQLLEQHHVLVCFCRTVGRT